MLKALHSWADACEERQDTRVLKKQMPPRRRNRKRSSKNRNKQRRPAKMENGSKCRTICAITASEEIKPGKSTQRSSLTPGAPKRTKTMATMSGLMILTASPGSNVNRKQTDGLHCCGTMLVGSTRKTSQNRASDEAVALN